MILKADLTKITEESHQSFLKQLTVKRPALKDFLSDFDHRAQKSWYHEFDPETVPHLVPISLKNKPAIKRSESVSDFMKRNRSSQKNESLTHTPYSNTERALPNAISGIKVPTPVKITIQSSKTEINIGGIPSDMLQRFQIKDKIRVIEETQKKVEDEINKPKMMKEILTKLAETVKSVFSVKRINTLNFSKLLAELEDSQRGQFTDHQETMNRVKELHKASQNWLTIIQTPRGEFVKIKPDYLKSNVKNDIEKYVARTYEQTQKSS
jgi:hypothetical protein